MNRDDLDTREIDRALDDALGPFVPTTEAEVARAEAELAAQPTPLPASLAEYRPRPKALAPKRGAVVPLVTHGAMALLGAAAALALTLRRAPAPLPSAESGGSATTSAVAATTSAVPVIDLAPAAACGSACCGGRDCAAAPKDLRTCPSGRACIGCAGEDPGAAQYRFKISGLAPSEAGKTALAAGPLEVCARVASSDLVCGPAYVNRDGSDRWLELPLVASAGDTISGVTVLVRTPGAKQALAEWSQPVPATPAVLCKGLLVDPRTPEGAVFGYVSLFLIDSSWVEIGRAGSVATLRAELARFAPGTRLSVFDTAQPGERRFALALGPYSSARAERVRWAVLEQGGQAVTVVGTDYRGAPGEL